MEMREHKNIGVVLTTITKDNVGNNGIVVAKVPVGTRIVNVNLSKDEAFNGTNNINIGVEGNATKFHNGVGLGTVGGVDSVMQHTATSNNQEVLVSVGGSVSTTGSAIIAITYVLPTTYVVNY